MENGQTAFLVIEATDPNVFRVLELVKKYNDQIEQAQKKYKAGR